MGSLRSLKMANIVKLEAILFMLIRWSKRQNAAWDQYKEEMLLDSYTGLFSRNGSSLSHNMNPFVEYCITRIFRVEECLLCREFGFCAKLSSCEINVHCECKFAKFSYRKIVLPRICPPRENEY